MEKLEPPIKDDAEFLQRCAALYFTQKDRKRFAKGLGFQNIDELRKAHGIAVKESFIKKFFKKLWSFLPNG